MYMYIHVHTELIFREMHASTYMYVHVHYRNVREYRRPGFNCEYLLNANCEIFKSSQSFTIITQPTVNTGVSMKHIGVGKSS
jgi:hypothetical protein